MGFLRTYGLTRSQGDTRYDLTGAATSAVTGHSGATDPHGDRAYANTQLANKAASTHTHAESDVTGLVADLAGRPPAPASGYYFYTASPLSSSTSAALGVGTLRVTPWLVERAFTLTRLAADVATIGDAGSKVRLGLYADSSGLPGALVVDAGQIAGDSATVQELTISQALAAGVYWVGAVVQSVTTTQPTLRTITSYTPPVVLPIATTLPTAAGSAVGWQATGVTGALPGTFPAGFTSGIAARIIGKAA